MQNLSTLHDTTVETVNPVKCKPYFSNKHSEADHDALLNEDGEIILKNKEIENIFNDYFGSIVENLNLEHWDEDSNSYSGINHRNNQRELDSDGFVGTILMDLLKAYDCISHELLIAKLGCYGLDEISLKLILSYLSHRKQRTKIGSSFSSWFDI